MDKIRDAVLSSQADMVALRREIHEEPELAFQERRTAARVVSFLEGEADLSLRRGLGRTGVLASIAGGTGKSVLLRVDMDALPIQEDTGTSYASKSPGIMHACGHDGHVAMGATAARLLARLRPQGAAHVLFQPAEEGEGGAREVVADGVMDGIERVIGVHLWNELPVGTIGVKTGPLMAAVDRLTLTIEGRGGHGASPHRAIDPIVAASYVVTALQTIVSREVAPIGSAVVTIGSIHGGQAFNVIPERVTLLGTIRTFDRDLRRSMRARITRIVSGVAAGLGCGAQVELEEGSDAVVNDPEIAEIARRAAAQVVGEKNVVVPDATMGGEDVSEYLRRAPGCFVFIGSANAEQGLAEPHHSPRFDFDEAALRVGCEFLVRAANAAMA